MRFAICLRHAILSLLMLWSVGAMAAEAAVVDKAAASDPVPEKTAGAIRAQMATVLRPEVEITALTTTPMPGIYQIEFDGDETAFVSEDGKWLITGDLMKVVPGKGMVNVTDRGKTGTRRDALAGVARDQMVVFPARGKEKHKLYVFTDVDCGYCRKMHSEIDELNAGGVTVNYLAFPRAGANSEAGRKMDAVWCAGNRGKALTEAKRGTQVPVASAACRSPVAEQYKLGVKLGVRGTPAVFTPDGEQIGGYVPAKKLLEQLDKP